MSLLRLEIVRSPAGPRAVARDVVGPLVARRRREAEVAAERIVAGARAEAERLVRDASAEADDIRARAAAAGRAEGELAWAEAARALAESHGARVDRLEHDLVRLSLEIARHVVGVALRTDESLVVERAARACASLRRDAALVLRISPANAGQVVAMRERLGERASVVIEVDAALDDGDCIAECAGVRVDATLGAQLTTVRRHLLGAEEELP